jgi:hypothetical protein
VWIEVWQFRAPTSSAPPKRTRQRVAPRASHLAGHASPPPWRPLLPQNRRKSDEPLTAHLAVAQPASLQPTTPWSRLPRPWSSCLLFIIYLLPYFLCNFTE